MNSKDPDTVPNRILSRLILAGRPRTAKEISLAFTDISRTSINRALTKLKERGQAEFLGRSEGWKATK